MLKTQITPTVLNRRQAVMARDPDACFIFFGANEVQRSGSTHFPFKQNTNFYYLTDFDEPGAVFVMAAGKTHLFVLPRDEKSEIWDGERYGIERAKSIFKVDEATVVDDFYKRLDEILVDAARVYYSVGANADRDRKIIDAVKKGTRHQGKGGFGNLGILDPHPLVSELRMIKDEHEIEFMKKACSATARAHLHVLKKIRVGMTEFDAYNEFQYHAFKYGATEMGYGPIFASGYNATTLHYTRNNEMLKHGDLLLIDAAGEVGGYTSDLTQTFPLSGKFSPEQKKVYEKVLEVNREITKMIKPGVSYRQLHERSTELLTEALLSLGVLEGDLASNLKNQTYRKYYPHGVGHYLGLDVHDTGLYSHRGQDFELKAGMILTNEPGLYFRERGSPYYGIGVRIEDDVLVTPQGSQVLTHELPRDVDTIENLRSVANS